jgi:hypothetical protein
MEEPTELQRNPHWGMAIWALRAGYLALAVALVGLIVILSGSTPWVLAAGVTLWLGAATVTVTGVVWARHELPEPRVGFWPLRLMLINDSVRPRCRTSGPDGRPQPPSAST